MTVRFRVLERISIPSYVVAAVEAVERPFLVKTRYYQNLVVGPFVPNPQCSP